MRKLAAKILEEFPKRKIIVVGDLVADQFLHGMISRVSREAPVFILRHEATETLAGGAANAAVNVASLGGKALAIGAIGLDETGTKLLDDLSAKNVNTEFVVKSPRISTTAKVRILAGQRHIQPQQVVRVDYENSKSLDNEIVEALKQNFLAAIEQADAVIISDYNYGVANQELTNLVIKTSHAKQIPVMVDSRFRLENFKNATSATPNQEEAEKYLGENFSDDDCSILRENLGFESLLITLGNRGMLLVENDKKPLRIEAVGAKKPVDVTGAGDTVIAAYALGAASGLTFAESANVANHAGGIVVMKQGTASVSPQELIESLEKYENLEKAQTL